MGYNDITQRDIDKAVDDERYERQKRDNEIERDLAREVENRNEAVGLARQEIAEINEEIQQLHAAIKQLKATLTTPQPDHR